jgi:hypothetical protein
MTFFHIPEGLSPRVNDALEDLNDLLATQKAYVDSVTILNNVSIDMDRTLEYRQQCADFKDRYVLHGIVVSVKSRYQLGPMDAMWLPKDLGRGRSIFDAQDVDKSALEDVTLGGFNDSVTINRTLEIDDMGNVKENSMLIIDTGLESLNSWEFIADGKNVNQLMEAWQLNEGVMNMDRRVAIAKEIGSEQLTYEDTTCALYHDGTFVYVTNGAVKNEEDMSRNLFRHSALGGYRFKEVTDNSEPFVQSDYGLADKTYGFSDLDERTSQRLQKNYHWKGDSEFNTFVLRPPSVKSTDKPGEILRTEYGYFSANDISHMMDADDILHIAPPDSSIKVPIDMQHSLFQKIVFNHKELDAMGFHIFSKAHTGEAISVPVKVIQQLK